MSWGDFRTRSNPGARSGALSSGNGARTRRCGPKVVFEDHRVRVWVLDLAPGERSAIHRHDHDHLLIQVKGDRIAVDPEPDTESPYREFFEAAVIPGMVTHVPRGGIETAVNTGTEPYYEIIVELKQ